MVQAALDAATELGERLVVVLGDPAFYRRFGFGPARDLGLTSPWSGLGEPWQALVLPPSTSDARPPPRGEVLLRRPGRSPTGSTPVSGSGRLGAQVPAEVRHGEGDRAPLAGVDQALLDQRVPGR